MGGEKCKVVTWLLILPILEKNQGCDGALECRFLLWGFNQVFKQGEGSFCPWRAFSVWGVVCSDCPHLGTSVSPSEGVREGLWSWQDFIPSSNHVLKIFSGQNPA